MKRLILLLAFATPLAAQVPISIQLVPPSFFIDEHNHAEWRVVVSSATPAGDVPLIFSTFAAVITAAPAQCLTALTRSDCMIDLPAGTPVELTFTVELAGPFGHTSAYASAGGTEVTAEAVFAHEYRVTNVNDSGEGSLRQALLDINRDCPHSNEPCQAVLAIEGAVPPSGYFTIRPLTPLPAIEAVDFVLDGDTQTRLSFDTNPSGGPEVFIDGSLVSEGHGLLLKDSLSRISNVVIGNFPGNGIEADGSALTVRRSWIGVDPTGVNGAPNGLRGVQVDRTFVTLVENVLSGNRRSGAFIVIDATQHASVRDNIIGLGADRTTPLGNGASGLYFAKSNVGYGHQEAAGNLIGWNAHAGIGVALSASGDFASNSFVHNTGLPIDVEIDGPTRDTRAGYPGQGGIVGVPTLAYARLQQDGSTIVSGVTAGWPASVSFGEYVSIYADGELVARERVQERFFNIRVPQNLAGRAIQAATYAGFAYNWDDPALGTSELSAPVSVEF